MFKLYNGCPNDELAAHWAAQDAARKRLKAAGLHATYFPAEGKWMVFTDFDSGVPHRAVTEFHSSLLEVAEVALNNVKEK